MPEPDVTTEPTAAPASPPSTRRSTLLGIVGIAAIALGLAQMYGGVGQIFGGANKKVSALLGESDAAVEKAKGHAEAADAAVNKLLEQLNTVDLATIRGRERATVERAFTACADAAGEFRIAASKIDRALALGVEGRVAEYLKLRSSANQSYSRAYDFKGRVPSAVLDEDIGDKDALLEQVNDAVAAANKLFLSAEDSVTRALEIAKELQAK
jgi:hypothetical protein